MTEQVARCRCAPDCKERIECAEVGTPGHMACGWCEAHDQARHICLCDPLTNGHATSTEECRNQPTYAMVFRCRYDGLDPAGCSWKTLNYAEIDGHENQLDPGHLVVGEVERVTTPSDEERS